jgi:hypothetical protein
VTVNTIAKHAGTHFVPHIDLCPTIQQEQQHRAPSL